MPDCLRRWSTVPVTLVSVFTVQEPCSTSSIKIVQPEADVNPDPAASSENPVNTTEVILGVFAES